MSYSLLSPQTSNTCCATLLSAEDSCLKRTATSSHLHTPQPTLFYTHTHCLPSGEEPCAVSNATLLTLNYLRVAKWTHLSPLPLLPPAVSMFSFLTHFFFSFENLTLWPHPFLATTLLVYSFLIVALLLRVVIFSNSSNFLLTLSLLSFYLHYSAETFYIKVKLTNLCSCCSCFYTQWSFFSSYFTSTVST